MEQETLVREEKGFTFADFWYVIRKFWLLIVAITAASTVIGAVYTFAFAKPNYKLISMPFVTFEEHSKVITISRLMYVLFIATSRCCSLYITSSKT